MFQGSANIRKNTENYCKNMYEVKLGSVFLWSALEMLGDAQRIFPREFSNFGSRGIE